MAGTSSGEGKNYARVVGSEIWQTHYQGQKVTTETPGARKRSTEDKEKVVRDYIVIPFKDWTGRIEKVSIKPKRALDGGKSIPEQLEVDMNDGSETISISMQFSSKYAISIMKALPNSDQNTEYTFNPHNYIPNGKTYTKIGVWLLFEGGEVNEQNQPKKSVLKSYFEQWDANNNLTYLHGFPNFRTYPDYNVGPNNFNEDQYSIFKINLVAYLKKVYWHMVAPKFGINPPTQQQPPQQGEHPNQHPNQQPGRHFQPPAANQGQQQQQPPTQQNQSSYPNQQPNQQGGNQQPNNFGSNQPPVITDDLPF